MMNKLKKAVSRLLQQIAKQNQVEFGKERMDCCNLNKTNKR